jgi:F-type H+/Na+-transporting ATPase subunit alpha
MASKEVGYINSIQQYLIKVEGLPNARINQVVATVEGQEGVIVGLSNNDTDILMFDTVGLKAGKEIYSTGGAFNITVGTFLLGRIINTQGVPVDGKSKFNSATQRMDIFRGSPGIPLRERIKEPFYTGIIAVDLLVPLGKGQRELIVGDAKSGKTFFILQSLLNQKLRNVVCVYAAIGKSEMEVKEIYEFLDSNGALFNTVIVSSSASTSSPLIYFAPYTAMTVAEFFQSQGRDVLIVFDDLSSHAKYAREIGLLAERMPGRESYPGDIFYTHSRLLERAGKFNAQNNSGSITALPIVETKYQDLTSFIPTTLMSMTDGHLYFNSELFYRGQRPALDVPLSVSRVGNQTQSTLIRDLSTRIRSSLATYNQIANLSRFGTDISELTQKNISIGLAIEEFLRQDESDVLEIEVQTFLLSLVYTNFIDRKSNLDIRKYRKKILFTLVHDTELNRSIKEMFKLEKYEDYLKQVETFVPKINEVCQETKNSSNN